MVGPIDRWTKLVFMLDWGEVLGSSKRIWCAIGRVLHSGWLQGLCSRRTDKSRRWGRRVNFGTWGSIVWYGRFKTLLVSLSSALLESVITSNTEYANLLQSFQKCLDLRDKYMFKSRQRLGDDPRHHDGYFPGLDDHLSDVSGVRPDANFIDNQPPSHSFKPWKIFPRPPPPHWHWSATEKIVSSDGTSKASKDEFRFEECEIPGPHLWTYELDDKGVYQVYDDARGSHSILYYVVSGW